MFYAPEIEIYNTVLIYYNNFDVSYNSSNTFDC